MEQVKAEPVACPFCDSEARIVAPLGAANVRAVECWNSNCAATGPWASNESKAITAWNRRANPQPAAVDGLVEVIGTLEKALHQIAGSHWERFGMEQTDIEELPDLSADEAMNLARETLMGLPNGQTLTHLEAAALRLLKELRDFDGWVGSYHAIRAHDAKQEAIALLDSQALAQIERKPEDV